MQAFPGLPDGNPRGTGDIVSLPIRVYYVSQQSSTLKELVVRLAFIIRAEQTINTNESGSMDEGSLLAATLIASDITVWINPWHGAVSLVQHAN